MTFQLMERPARNRRKEPGDWDNELERELLATIDHGRAVVLPLWRFHTSPAKGRLWQDGYKVRHRVLADKQTVAAWVE